MYFTKEKQMLPVVEAWLDERTDFMAAEFGCGFQSRFIPDIVGIVCDANAVRDLTRRTPRSRGDIRRIIGAGEVPEMYHSDMIAVELKMSNFPQAYFQAKMYSQFGFCSYIAMPVGTWDSVGHIRREVLKIDGLGFIEVGDGCAVRAEARRPRYYSIEEEAQISERLIMRFKKQLESEGVA